MNDPNPKRILYAVAVGIFAIVAILAWPRGERRMGTNFPFNPAGDLSGTYASQTVVALQGEPMVASTSSPPSRGALLEYTDAGWAPLGTGASGTVLTAGGAGADPSWADASAGGWTTNLDINLIAQTGATFATDTTYTFAGISGIRKVNSAGDSFSLANINGSGLHVLPASATDLNGATFTLPWLGFPLTTIAPGLGWATPTRIWAYISSQNITTSNDAAVVGVVLYDATFPAILADVSKYGVTPSGTGIGATVDVQNTQTNAYGAAGITDNVVMVEYPTGVGVPRVNVYSGTWSSGWPSLQSLHGCAYVSSTSGTLSSSSSHVHDATALYAILGAMRATSATNLNIAYGQLRIDTKQ